MTDQEITDLFGRVRTRIENARCKGFQRDLDVDEWNRDFCPHCVTVLRPVSALTEIFFSE